MPDVQGFKILDTDIQWLTDLIYHHFEPEPDVNAVPISLPTTKDMNVRFRMVQVEPATQKEQIMGYIELLQVGEHVHMLCEPAEGANLGQYIEALVKRLEENGKQVQPMEDR